MGYKAAAAGFKEQEGSNALEKIIMAADDTYSPRDRDGVKHMLLCSVLRGNVQQCERGCGDFSASAPQTICCPRKRVFLACQLSRPLLTVK